MVTAFKGEKIEKNMATKIVYYFYDTEENIEQLSKEVYKNKDMFVHYPRGFEGGQKYRTIKKFTYLGFKGKPPVGTVKSPVFGYGFTKKLNPFSKHINDNFNFKEVIIKKGGETKIDKIKNILHLSERSLQNLHNTFDDVFKKNKAETASVLATVMHDLFPAIAKKPKKNYIANALSSSLSSWGNSIDEFSDSDKKAISELFDKLSIGTDFLTSDSLKKTKEIVDNKYIEETLKKFDKLFKQTTGTATLEKKWQQFLKENSWVFSSVFSQPVILYKDEAYVGGKSIENKGGKFTDFLIKNSLSDNVSFFEIKTHKTKLLEDAPYRGNDVFSATKELTGCINQVLNQRDKFQKTFSSLKLESEQQFETFNSKCVVLVGAFSDLTKKQKYSFELLRSNSRDVEIITFDEIKKKIESLKVIMSGQA